MKKILTLLVASTALATAIVVPAWSAMHTPKGGNLRLSAALFNEGAQAIPHILTSNDDDRRYRNGSRRGHHRDDDDEDNRSHSAGDRAPAGTIAPARNALFGNGAPPQVQLK